MTEELYSKIDKFCNETDWKKYPTYENALEEFINGIVAEGTKELQEEVNKWKTKFENLQKYLDTQNCYRECAETWKKLIKSKELIKKLRALYLSPVVTNDDIKRQDEILNEAEQFLNSEVEK